jgi:hypothetical protein
VRQGNALNVMTHIDPCTPAKVVNR